jgi:hypothetical protein
MPVVHHSGATRLYELNLKYVARCALLRVMSSAILSVTGTDSYAGRMNCQLRRLAWQSRIKRWCEGYTGISRKEGARVTLLYPFIPTPGACPRRNDEDVAINAISLTPVFPYQNTNFTDTWPCVPGSNRSGMS